ncbi:twin-arginine translocase TatA/TatE family subunit [Pelagibacteraceae bacterium]|jgi:sec-independent protein translocase protein TatA|nr:twin-arginine translocase TatA/TatE family subunit [Pelagibacteraceae bacterium]
MGNIGWTGIIIIAILVVILFGKGKISSIMGDLAKGIKSFKKGLSDDNSGKDNSNNDSDNTNNDSDNSNSENK